MTPLQGDEKESLVRVTRRVWLPVARYGLNIGFNLLNKTVFNYFPFPWTVSAIHVVVGALYCGVTYLLGFKEASFGRVRPHNPGFPSTDVAARRMCPAMQGNDNVWHAWISA